MARTNGLYLQRAIAAIMRELPRGRIDPPPAPAPAPAPKIEISVAPAPESQPKSLQERRRDLWIGTAIATAGSSNCTSPNSAARFANQAVIDFDRLVAERRL